MAIRFHSALFVIAIILATTALATTAARGEEERLQDKFQTLEWQQLVPDNWEPPIIAQAHDEAVNSEVDQASLVVSLEGQAIRLPGFMKPTELEGHKVSEFLLVPFLPHHVKQHAHLEPNQMVFVSLPEAMSVDNPFDPIWVSGTMLLETVMTDEGPIGYRLSNAAVENYVY